MADPRAYAAAKAKEGPQILRIGEAVREFLRKSGLKHRRVDGDLAQAWRAAVGEELARRTRLQGFSRDRVLMVEVDSPAVRQELATFRKAAVLEKLRAALPERPIRDLKIAMAGAKP